MRIPGDKSWDIWEEDVTARTDFSKTIRKIRNYWPYSILCAVILVVLALLYLYKTNPVYNVTTSILIQDNDQKGGSSGGFISSLQDVGLLRASDNVHDEQMIITSYPLVENVVNDLQLFLRFSIKENIKNISLYKTSLPFKVDVVDFSLRNTKNTDTESISYKVEWDNNKGYTISSGDQIFKGLWNVPLQTSFGKIVFRKNNLTKEWPGDKVITMTVYPVSEVTDQIISDLNASIPNKQTNIINLSLHTATPALGVDVLNALIASYQSATVNDNNKLNDSTLQFINQRLLIVGRELDSIEMGIQQFKQQNQLTNLPKQSDVLVDNLSKQDQALNSQLVQLSMINSLIGYLDDNKDNPRVIPASLVINDNSLSQTIENYNRLLSARERLELSATNENPIFRNIEDQLAGLQKSIRTSLETARLTLSTGIGKMKQQSSSLTGMMRDVPAIEREFGNFNRQQTIKRDLYLFLLQKREESLLAKSSTIANSKIIGPARASKKPIKPKRELIILSSVLAGLLIPFGYEWLVSLFNNKIRTKDDIKNLTELPIVGEIGFKKEDGMVTTNNARNLTAEQFRALRTNIQFLLNQ